MSDKEQDETVVEKVQLVEDLIASYATGVKPTDEQLRRAAELGIDTDAMESSYESPIDF